MVRLFSQIENSTNTVELLTLPQYNNNQNSLNENLFQNEDEKDSESDDEEDLMASVDEEIVEELCEISKLNFLHLENKDDDNDEVVTNEETNFNFNDEYDFSRGKPIEELRIELGTDQLPRW
jgi:hypothetical protein